MQNEEIKSKTLKRKHCPLRSFIKGSYKVLDGIFALSKSCQLAFFQDSIKP